MSAFVRKLGNIEKVSSLGIGNCQSFIMWWTTQLRELGAEFSFHYGSELTPLPGLWNENTVKAFAWVAVDARGQKHQHQRFRREFTEGRMEFLRKNLSSNSLLQNYIKLIISLPIIITVVQSEFVVCLPFVNNLHKFVLTFISSP